jgi:transcriptional regulator with XRE-family HTH domain
MPKKKDGYQIFGSSLKNCMASKGLYQYQLAFLLSIHPKTVERIVKGTRKTSFMEVIDIALVLSNKNEVYFYHLINEWISYIIEESEIEFDNKKLTFIPNRTNLASACQIAVEMADGDDQKFDKIILSWFKGIKSRLESFELFDIRAIPHKLNDAMNSENKLNIKH